MEVAGSRQEEDDVPTPSDKHDRFCQPCTTDGEQIPAAAYCRRCNEFMCQACAKVHRKSKATKSHDILDDDAMPDAPVTDDEGDEDRYAICETHSSPTVPAIVKFYCASHDEVGCGECIVVSHKACTTEYIQDVAKTFKSDTEIATLQKTLTSVDNKVDACKKTIHDVYEANMCADLKALEDVREFKTEMTTYIDKKEDEMMVEVSDKKDEDEREKKEKLTECLKAKKELIDIRKQVESGTQEVSKRFAELKRAKTHLQHIEKRVLDAETHSVAKRRKYTFQRDPDLAGILTMQKPLGKMTKVVVQEDHGKTSGTVARKASMRKDISKAKFTHIANINLQCKDNENSDIYISGMVHIPPNYLLLADTDGYTIIAVDMTTNKIQSHLKLSSAPWDLAALPNNEIAVTLSGKKMIQIVGFQDGVLLKVRYFRVSGKCCGIDYCNNMLVVSYVESMKVELMDLSGRLINKRTNANTGDDLFECPEYCTFTNSGEDILVSDWSKDTITRLSSHFQVVDVYAINSKVSGVRGIFCCRDGSILVCGSYTGNMQVLSEHGRPLGVILDKDETLDRPVVVYVSDDMETMYIASENECVVKVYRLTYK